MIKEIQVVDESKRICNKIVSLKINVNVQPIYPISFNHVCSVDRFFLLSNIRSNTDSSVTHVNCISNKVADMIALSYFGTKVLL